MTVKKAQLMPTFAYDGVDRKGVKIKGELSAKNMALAKVTLRKQGVTVRNIREKRKNILEGLFKKSINARYHDFHATTCNYDESWCPTGTRF